MNFINYLHIENKKIKLARHIGLIACLVLGLLSAMILSFYHSTEILYQFYLGYTLLRLSVFFFACIIACSTVFDKFFSS